jgi:small conductance mechanosensitive channel
MIEKLEPEHLLGYLTGAVTVLLIVIVGWLLAGWLGRITRRAMERTQVDATLTRFFSRAVRWLILTLVAITVLTRFGVETTSFAALIGAAGLAIGLAFQGSLSNFSAGVMLLVFRPFRVGDVVEVGGVTGKVEEISLFTSIIDTPDNRRFILPNSEVFENVIENKTYHSTRRVDISVGTDYGADLDHTREVLMGAAQAVPGRLDDPAPQVVLQELGGSSIDWSIRVWSTTEDFWTVREATVREVKVALDAAGIGIPFPQMDVHMDRTDA